MCVTVTDPYAAAGPDVYAAFILTLSMTGLKCRQAGFENQCVTHLWLTI